MNNKLLSVIIPCYNSGEFLPDALESLDACSENNIIEVIVVNDGSTDKMTLSLLDELHAKGYNIIHQENKGPAAARNTGVRNSSTDFILFLDSDNMVRSDYISKGINILNTHPDVGVVYGKPNFFGDTTDERFTARKFSIYTIILGNYIDMCSLVRKKMWQDIGGFDEERVLIGHEDWEFWIRAGAAGWKFHYLDQVLYDYRVRAGSLVKQATESTKFKQMHDYVVLKHHEIFTYYYRDLHRKVKFYQRDQNRPFRSFLKFLYRKYFAKKPQHLL